MPSVRRLPHSQRRAVIDAAAAQLFAEQGYVATTLEQVAEAAGVTKQLLYRHVASKRELHLGLLAAHRDGLVGRIAAGMASGGPPEERIRRTLDSWFSYVEDHAFAARLLFRDTTGDPEIEAFHEQMRTSARAANAAVLRAPPFDTEPEEVELLAELVRSAMVGLAVWWADHPEVPRAVLVGAALRTFADGLVRG